jgi:hypothetical protein
MTIESVSPTPSPRMAMEIRDAPRAGREKLP